MDGPDRRDAWLVVRQWGPVIVVALLSQSGVGATQSWTGSSATQVLGSLALALPLALRVRAPLVAAALVALAAVAQVPLGESLPFGAFLAVLVAAYGVGRHEPSNLRAGAGTALLIGGAMVAGSMESEGMTTDVVIPVVYLSSAAALGRLVRHLATQAERLHGLNASLEREREQQAELAVAAERLRIARELHDVVAHRIMLMVIQAEAAVETIERDTPAARTSLLRIQEAGRQGLEDLRGLVKVLRTDSGPGVPPGLADLDALATVLREAGLDVALERRGDLDGVDQGLQEAVFRVAQEALTNVLKHSAASQAAVSVRADAAGLCIDVHDPGPSTHAEHTDGQGLRGMSERLAAYGGAVHAGPDGAGFRVRASVPA